MLIVTFAAVFLYALYGVVRSAVRAGMRDYARETAARGDLPTENATPTPQR